MQETGKNRLGVADTKFAIGFVLNSVLLFLQLPGVSELWALLKNKFFLLGH